MTQRVVPVFPDEEFAKIKEYVERFSLSMFGLAKATIRESIKKYPTGPPKVRGFSIRAWGREKPFIASSIGWPMTKPKQGALPIRRASQGDRPEWLRMRAALWPDETHAKHREEMDEYLRGKGAVAYVAARPSGGLAGFVEATIRPHADGCDTSPVGYVEGWYVDADVRQRGVGRRLVRTAERWARERGCTEMGLQAHLAIGYEERERLIHFRRWLARPAGRPRS